MTDLEALTKVTHFFHMNHWMNEKLKKKRINDELLKCTQLLQCATWQITRLRTGEQSPSC